MKQLGAVLLLSGCATLGPAVAVNDAHVQKALLVELTDEARVPSRVFSISPLPDGRYELITTKGRRVVSATGAVLERTDFRTERLLFPVVACAGDGRLYAGADERALLIFDDAGGERLSLPLRDSARFALHGCDQVIVQDGDGKALRIHDLDAGGVTGRVELGEYVTGLAAAGDEWIVFTYPTADRQGAFHVLDREGRELASWPVKPESNFSVVDGNVLTAGAEGFTLRTTRGEVVQRFPVSSAEKFSRPMGARLADGRWVFVAGGDGGFPHFMVTVFSPDGALLYKEIADGRAHALFASEDAFLVGDEHRVWRYTTTRDGQR